MKKELMSNQQDLYRSAYYKVRELETLLHKLEPHRDDERLYNFAVLITAKLYACQAELTYKSATTRREEE